MLVANPNAGPGLGHMGAATLILTDWWERTTSTEDLQVVACDPHGGALQAENRPFRSLWSFADIAGGALDELPPDVVLCSFCLHLLRDDEALSDPCALSRSSRLLLVATPHKRPTIDKSMGWEAAADEVRASDDGRGRDTVPLHGEAVPTTRVRDG